MGCTCSYETTPILQMRGICSDSYMDTTYTPMQLPAKPTDVFMVGKYFSEIQFNSLHQWAIRSMRYTVNARSDASHNSYALGKHNWTIYEDNTKCSKDQSSYNIEMKLTGCREDEFTCDDGQCVKMEERCNQLSNCRDESDEMGCKILILKHGYKKRVPPITSKRLSDNSVVLVPVRTSLTLYKVVAIQEEDHSIELQFEITLEWKENRATYYNLKKEDYLNALSMDDINRLWLPLVVYINTDQQETTRLGENWEWSTNVLVKREGKFQRSGYEVLDEIEIFKGDENSLSMVQSYTHEFQCVYQLENYPFDTQVQKTLF